MNEKKQTLRIAVIGGGPAGVFAAIFAAKKNEVTVFEQNEILKTLLPTGGGRCNLAHNEYDFKELAKYYPRGEKFLYSVLSRFSTKDTVEFFDCIGVKTYVQPDSRIFPVSDSSKDVAEALRRQLKKVSLKKEKVTDISRTGTKFRIKTQKGEYDFDAVILAAGGKGAGHKIAKSLGHNITDLKPALTALKIKEKHLCGLAGLSLKNISAKVSIKKSKTLTGDLLFTHEGISGPLTFKISSYHAFETYNGEKPLNIVFNLVNRNFEEFDEEFCEKLKKYPQKDIQNVLCLYVPKRLSDLILKTEKINPAIKSGQLSKIDRIKLTKKLTSFVLNAVSPAKGEEIVTAGGVDLKEVDAKTMESKIVKGLYFCGEILDIDGLTGGFNLQNCWSTGYIAGSSLQQV